MAVAWRPIAAVGIACGCALGQPARDDAADKRALEVVCGSCHSVTLVEGLRSQPEWVDTVEQMVKLGARGSDDQFDRLMRFLLRNLTKININSAAAPQIAAVLDIGDAVADAVVKRRTEIGKFATLDDVKVTPGIDAAKVEARRDRIVF